MKKSVALILALVFFIGGSALTLYINRKAVSMKDQSAAALLATTSAVSSTSTSTSTIDTFVKSVPQQIAALQAIQKDPTTFKNTLQKFAPTSVTAGVPAHRSWAVSSWFFAPTCETSRTLAPGQVVRSAGNGMCFIWQAQPSLLSSGKMIPLDLKSAYDTYMKASLLKPKHISMNDIIAPQKKALVAHTFVYVTCFDYTDSPAAWIPAGSGWIDTSEGWENNGIGYYDGYGTVCFDWGEVGDM